MDVELWPVWCALPHSGLAARQFAYSPFVLLLDPSSRPNLVCVKLARLGIAALLTPIAIIAAATPAQAAPPQARSWYITSYSPSWAYDRGCNLGAQDLGDAGKQTHYVVLDFGAMYDAGSDFKFTAFGGPDMTMSQAKDMIVEYSRGYFLCTGSDTTSELFIASGTNNSGGDITYAAGSRLAVLARSAGNQIENAGYDGQVHPIGASDFESWGAGASRATASRNWIDGYNATSQRPLFVNYGWVCRNFCVSRHRLS